MFDCPLHSQTSPKPTSPIEAAVAFAHPSQVAVTV
jgi:hypothetical protein